jgi:hypothetical protein
MEEGINTEGTEDGAQRFTELMQEKDNGATQRARRFADR